MRLTAEQQSIIKQEVQALFGLEAEVWLFGSRVNDNQRGGDIDLYIETNDVDDNVLHLELKLYAQLIKHLGDQRIDIVVHQKGKPLKAVHEQARKTGIQL